MVSAKNVLKMFNPPSEIKSKVQNAPGIIQDNPRENIDPHIKSKVIQAIEIICEKIKSNSNLSLFTNNTERMTILNSGKVGIGVLTPLERLNVDSSIKLGQGYGFIMAGYGADNNNANGDMYFMQNAYYSSGTMGDNLNWKWINTHGGFGSRGIAFGYGNGISFFCDNAASTSDTAFIPTERMRIQNNGKIMIGSSIINPNSLVTLGTTNPSISTDTTDGDDTKELMLCGGGAIGAERGSAIIMRGNENTYLGSDGALDFFAGATATGTIRFFTGLGSSEALRIAQNGSVGIGSNNPTSPLYVVGNVSADSFTDRTPFYDGDAVDELTKVNGNNGIINHYSLPEFARKTKTYLEPLFNKVATIVDDKEVLVDVPTGEFVEKIAEERDLGAMISILTKAIQQLNDRLTRLELK